MIKQPTTKLSDARPKKGGWAPGGYFRLCGLCKKNFIGDKRAIECADCAYGTKPK